MDARLAQAVGASLAWYDDVFAEHRIPTALTDGLWRALGEPPRWHSAAKTTRRSTGAHAVLDAVERFPRCAVADSFGSLDLTAGGFEVLFEATWVHHPGVGPVSGLPHGWTVVEDPELMSEWNAAHDTTDVLLPSLLTNPRFTFLACSDGGGLSAGAVLHDCPGPAVGMSNGWTRNGSELDPAAVLACAGALHPERPVVDYAHGADLEALVGAGFSGLGPQVVWVR